MNPADSVGVRPETAADAFLARLEKRLHGHPGLQFRGARNVPDEAHPWVNTPPERFREYMGYLNENKYRVVALRDVERYIDRRNLPDDPLIQVRYVKPKS